MFNIKYASLVLSLVLCISSKADNRKQERHVKLEELVPLLVHKAPLKKLREQVPDAFHFHKADGGLYENHLPDVDAIKVSELGVVMQRTAFNQVTHEKKTMGSFPLIYGTMPDLEEVLEMNSFDAVYQKLVPADAPDRGRQLEHFKVENDDALRLKAYLPDNSINRFDFRVVYLVERRLVFITLRLDIMRDNPRTIYTKAQETEADVWMSGELY